MPSTPYSNAFFVFTIALNIAASVFVLIHYPWPALGIFLLLAILAIRYALRQPGVQLSLLSCRPLMRWTAAWVRLLDVLVVLLTLGIVYPIFEVRYLFWWVGRQARAARAHKAARQGQVEEEQP
jgi:hypothetical protein